MGSQEAKEEETRGNKEDFSEEVTSQLTPKGLQDLAGQRVASVQCNGVGIPGRKNNKASKAWKCKRRTRSRCWSGVM